MVATGALWVLSYRVQALNVARRSALCLNFASPTQTQPQLLMQALIADFFFILVALAWFAAGLGVKAATASSVRCCPVLPDLTLQQTPWHANISGTTKPLSCQSQLLCCLQVVLDLWLALWPTLFQPALGILMAGAVSNLGRETVHLQL